MSWSEQVKGFEEKNFTLFVMRSLATIFGVWWARAFRRSPITFISSSGLTSSCCSSGLVSRSRLLCSFGGGTLDEVLCNMVDKERTIENAGNYRSTSLSVGGQQCRIRFKCCGLIQQNID